MALRAVSAGAGWLAAALALAGGAARAQIFVERAAAQGLDFTHVNGASGKLYFAEIMGSGGALLDFDGDGDLDLYLLQGQPLGGDSPLLTDRLWRNDLQAGAGGGLEPRWVEVTAAAGLLPGDYSYGAATGDYDNDGWVDLYVAAFGANRLLRNQGDGSFVDVTAASGAGDPRWSAAASFVDVDRDGWLDLYVVNYVDFSLADHRFCPDPTGARDYCGPSAYDGVPDRLFRNRGDGTFADVSAASGIAAAAGAGLGVVAADLDEDGWPDLYVANDGEPNFLWINQRDGTFRDDAMIAGCAVNAEGVPEASMGVLAEDLDGDGREDLFLTHLNNESHTLYLNQGGGLFRDATAASGLAEASWLKTGFGIAAVDVDLDARLDLLVANGAVTRFAGRVDGMAQPPQLFRNLGAGRFREVPAAEAGPAFAARGLGRGVASGDLDNDGDRDAVALANGGPARLLMSLAAEAGAERSWIGVRVASGRPPRDCLGVRVDALLAGRPPVRRRVHTDGSYASASDPRLQIGLDGAPRVTLRLRSADGGAVELRDLPAGRYVVAGDAGTLRGCAPPPRAGSE